MKAKNVMAFALIVGSFSAYAGDKEYEEALKEYNKRLIKINADLKEKKNADASKALADAEFALYDLDNKKRSNDEKMTKAHDKLTKTKAFLEVLDNSPENMDIDKTISKICDEDSCLGSKKSELKEALSEYKTCKKYSSRNMFGIGAKIGGDGCDSMDKIKTSVGQVKYEAGKEEEKLAYEKERLTEQEKLQKKTRDHLHELDKNVLGYDKKKELEKAVLSMKLKNQGDIFDTKLLLMDVDQLKKQYEFAKEDSKDAEDMIEAMAAAASSKLDETIFGKYVNQKIDSSKANLCEEIKECDSLSSKVNGDEGGKEGQAIPVKAPQKVKSKAGVQ